MCEEKTALDSGLSTILASFCGAFLLCIQSCVVWMTSLDSLSLSLWFFVISIFHRQPAIEFALLVSAGIQGMLIFLHQHQVTALSVSGM
jgi:hypothetical protein